MELFIIILLSLFSIFLLYKLIGEKKQYVKMNKKTKKKYIRKCPLCGSLLDNPGDCVLGEYSEVEGKKKVYLYGCNYCYKGKKHSYRIDL